MYPVMIKLIPAQFLRMSKNKTASIKSDEVDKELYI